MVDRLSTGISAIDRRLDGGFKAGSLVALVTPPAAQSHAVIQQLMHQRPSVYVTSLRSAASIEHELNGLGDGDLPVSIQEVGEAVQEENKLLHELSGSQIHAAKTAERERLLDQVYEVVQRVDGVCNLVVDPVNPLERSQSRTDYQNLLSKVAERLLDTESVGLLHCTLLEEPPSFRETTLTFADVVWELDIASGRRNDLEIHTRIPKNRGGAAVLEDLTLLVEDGRVMTDDSRNI